MTKQKRPLCLGCGDSTKKKARVPKGDPMFCSYKCGVNYAMTCHLTDYHFCHKCNNWDCMCGCVGYEVAE